MEYVKYPQNNQAFSILANVAKFDLWLLRFDAVSSKYHTHTIHITI